MAILFYISNRILQAKISHTMKKEVWDEERRNSKEY
jgi:hypothetical protein